YNHPVLCLVDMGGVPLLLWKLLEEIRPGDRVLLARIPRPVEELAERDRQRALLLGAFVAGGFVSEARAGFASVDEAFFDEVLAAYDAVVGGPRHVHDRVVGPGRRLFELDAPDLAGLRAGPLAELAGKTSAEQVVPETVWRHSQGFKRVFLQALFSGDGSSFRPRKAIEIVYSTASDQLAKDVQLLLLEFGVVSRLCRLENGETRVVIATRSDARLFVRNVGFLGAGHEKLASELETIPAASGALGRDRIPFVADSIRSERGARREHGGAAILERVAADEVERVIEPLVGGEYHYAEVASVADAGIQPVYSLRVETRDHAFLTNGFVSHNTEARLQRLAADTVDFGPNYDETKREPLVLPARFPNLLVNGSAGIAVGMATNMPPH